MPRRAGSALLATAGLACALLAGCTSSSPSAQQQAARTFLDAVGAGKPAAAAPLTDRPTTAAAELRAGLAGLGAGARARFDVAKPTTTGDTATTRYTAHWTLPGTGTPWSYTGTLPLRRVSGRWIVEWHTSDLNPGLPDGTHLQVQRVQPARAAVQDSTGRPLVVATPVVRVGIERKLVKNLDQLASALAAVPQLQSTAAEIKAAVRAAAPTAFVPVITLRRSVYEQVRSRIHDLDGTVFQDDTLQLPPAAHYAEPLLGTVGPATADQVARSRGRLRAGDQAGTGGVQQALDATLAGTPGTTVVAASADGTTLRTLATVTRPQPGRPVRLTLERPAQDAAEAALAGVRQQAAIVAVQRSTGRILADANTPAVTYDVGLAGAFPAGSTFKMVTWSAAFTADPALLPGTDVPCPATYTVDGRRFENENRFSHPPIPISAAFGYSCNTSAIAAGMRLPAGALARTARALGLGGHWTLPVDAFAGTLPEPAGATEKAADAIGQGRVQVSPLLMALVADAVTTGRPVAPSLLADRPGTAGTPLPAALVAKMTSLMRATVDLPGGTAHALAGLGGVEGKTGTAEYGNATPPRSHSWFAGVRGDVAFAVFVYDGASAGVDAVPIARAFLRGLR